MRSPRSSLSRALSQPLSRALTLLAASLVAPACGAAVAQAATPSAPYTVSGALRAPDGPWDYASVDEAAHRLFLGRGDGVLALDLESGAITPTLVPGQRVHGVLPLPGGLAVSANGNAATATLFTAADGKVLATLPTGRKPDAIAWEPVSKLVVVMNGKDGTATLIDPAARQVVGTVDIGGALEFAVADGKGHVFVNVEDRNEMAELDIAAGQRKVVARHALPGCDSPSGLAIDTASGTLVAACANGRAVALDAATGKVRGTPAIGAHPDAVIFDAAHHRFLVPAGGAGVLNVLEEGADGAVTAGPAVATAKGARTGALDPRTGKVYLPTADWAKPAKPGERPAALPGSFRILVLSPS